MREQSIYSEKCMPFMHERTNILTSWRRVVVPRAPLVNNCRHSLTNDNNTLIVHARTSSFFQKCMKIIPELPNPVTSWERAGGVGSTHEALCVPRNCLRGVSIPRDADDPPDFSTEQKQKQKQKQLR